MAFLQTLSRFAGLSFEKAGHKNHSWQDLVELRRQRKVLGKLTDRELRDIGLTPYDVEREVSRSFFDVPSHGPRT
ncbi:DUF1127 domain-containing protein [Cognatishimia activa]|uniref:YjiS-like domain-containing protein n=1 Tax=Cognatishimia activa TaxID=1715691 RepID=A0A0P1ITJ3_9RHOB|nr:DUF1127 domain-containing protein [Cognatishimia activa]MEE2945680.1 DUF1127 domain-containing protein [Pseudomonadota bacterium]CUI77665.1 hypothetical protein TA5113_01433 [Cognatishimia activa]CUK26786.1 hypothetical protein TA5114_02604 [Cognatishimia activa]